VTKVATGEGGVIHGKRVKRFIDLSTTGSRVAIEIAATLAKRNIVQIDAPVSGGVAGAEKGTLAVMVSGPLVEVAMVKDALAVFGKVFVIGEKPGMGQTMKLANNVLSACNMAASCEAVVLAAKSGIDPKVAVDVMNAGSGRNSATSDKWPREMLPRTFNWGFATALMTKDVRLALAEMKELGVPHDIMDAVGRAWEACIAEIGPDKDFTTILQPVEKRGGITVKGGAA
jgi:3-hydroxyisobutyrate dehydrogenase-like beta-hydroxyacid dehydrogenase